MSLVRSLAVALSLGALLAGCATSPATGIVRAAPTAGRPSAPVASCRFQVAGVEDLREDKRLGRVASREVEGQEFPAWFGDGLARIPGYATDAAPVQVHVQILKAYIQSMSTMMSANVLVRARIEAPGHSAILRTYRGVDDSVNWVTADTEIQNAFDRALADLGQHLQADLSNACRT